MRIYSVADNIISPLGQDTRSNYGACAGGNSGITEINDYSYFPEPFFGAAIHRDTLNLENINENNSFLEGLFILSITDAIRKIENLNKKKTVLVISSTKGNIDLLHPDYNGSVPKERSSLDLMAKQVNRYFGFARVIVVSNACISGLSAIITAKRFIEMGDYDHAIVSGGDILSEFVISGFHSLKAISDRPCRPYDAKRNGITLGEACGTMVLTRDFNLYKGDSEAICILEGAQTNDANHISGPSRTGKGLQLAITKAMKKSRLKSHQINYINAHGTATNFNDEMEAIAFNELGIGETPINSLKGYFGHTLGAAGIIESIITIQQLRENQLLASKGYFSPGVSKPLNILNKSVGSNQLKYALKTTSGFGGCNAALIFEHL